MFHGFLSFFSCIRNSDIPQYDLQLGLPGPGGWRCGDWDDPCIECITSYNFYGHFNPETFWFLGRPVEARYDIAPMDQWHSVSRWMQIECCRISFDLFLDRRPSTFRRTVEIWNQINFYIQNVSTTVAVGKSSHGRFWAQKIGGFHHLGIENRSQHFSPLLSFKSCATSLHELWTPLLGRSCCANRPWGVNVWGVWTGNFRHKP